MRIERIYDITEIMKCLPMEREIRKKHRDDSRESDTLLFIQTQLQNPFFGFWIAYGDKDEIIGYTCGILSNIVGMERLIVLRLYSKNKEVTNKFLEIGKEWAKQYKVKLMQIVVKKHAMAFKRIFKFVPVSIVMERRI